MDSRPARVRRESFYTTTVMKASKSAYILIHTFEGCRLHAYRCPAGVWTIGWGHTAGVYEGMTITRERANELLEEDVRLVEDSLTFALGIDQQGRMPNGLTIGQHQFDALLSFTYNVGIGNLARSTLLKKVKANPADSSIRGEFSRWVYGGGKRLPGLVRRRKMEADLYFSK